MAKIKNRIIIIFGLIIIPCFAYQGDINKRDCLKSTYESQIGIREASNNNDGPEVEAYLKSAGFGPGFAWCGAFVNWVHKQCNIKTVKSPAWSPSWFPEDKIIYKRDEKIRRTPLSGDVFGIWFQSKGRIAHVGFIDAWDNDSKYALTVEGNTNEGGSREGDGVYRKRRLKRQIYIISSFVD